MSNENDNPYNNILKIMQEQGEEHNPVPFFIGTVATASPLTVQVGEILLEREDMKINSFLLKGYRRRMSLATAPVTGTTAATSGGGGDEAFSSHSHGQNTLGIPDGAFTTLDDFRTGEEVLLLMSADRQQYILLCKLA